MNKFFKMMFFCSLIMSSILTVSAYSWLTMWIGVEINLLSMIPLMISKNNNYSSESSMKYFLIQSMASTLMIFSITMLEKNHLNSLMFEVLLQISILMKLGVAPVHWWLPEVMEGISWMNCLVMLTWQKIAPMIMLMMTLKNSIWVNATIILSSLVSGIQGLNQISMRKILAYSSINHMAWMLMSMMSSSWIWYIYFIVYSVSNLILILYLNYMKIYFINQINILKNNKIYSMMMILNFISLSGIPPFIGFLPKWLTIHYTMKISMIMPVILIISSLIHTYFYMRIIMPTLMMKVKESKLKNLNIYKSKIMMLNVIFLFSLPLTNLMY
nr:NADH dehydrogenase subunit 2 [Thlaspida biramosa]